MKWARLLNGIVQETIKEDPKGRYHPSVEWLQCPEAVGQGWIYADSAFSPPLPPTPEEQKIARFARLRAERDRRIVSTDYLLMTDYPLSDEARAAVSAYRQALRDLPAQDGAPWDGGGALTPWPMMPELNPDDETE